MIYHFDELSFQILNVDRFFHKEGIFDVKARPYAAFSFRLSGTGDFEMNGKRILAKPGDVLFLPANTPYRVEYSVGESMTVHFCSCNYQNAENFEAENPVLIQRLFGDLWKDWGEFHSVNRAKSEIYQILDAMANDRKASVQNTAFFDCVSYIEAHFCDSDLVISDVCRIGFMSPSGLQRMFLKNFGVSPKQYLDKLRTDRAIRLLAENRLSVKEIAFACGFSDEKYFSRAIKKKYGYPPARLRSHMSE